MALSEHELSALDDLLSDEQKRILDGMPDQEIRARALECAVKLFPPPADSDFPGQPVFLEIVHQFEAYIRDGVT